MEVHDENVTSTVCRSRRAPRLGRRMAREVAQHIQRIQKTLENANIKLTSVISNIIGTSGRRILKAMIAGETNPIKLTVDMG